MSNSQDLSQFMQDYEHANNSHTWSNVEPFIALDATYWFTDGSHSGIKAIRKAVEATFAKIHDEVYTISNIQWPIKTDSVAVCTYAFSWRGIVDDKQRSGHGRGTNAFVKTESGWQIVHEHLSKKP